MSRHYSLYKIGYPDYSIDKEGNVYSGKKYYKGLRLKPTNRNNYLAVSLRKNGKSKSFNIHRLVAMTFVHCDGDFKDYQVNHKDGNKLNNCPDNLEWCSAKENSKHRDKLALQKRKHNEESSNWKRYNREIKVIKRLYREFGLKQFEIADLFELSQGYISEVVNGKKRAKAIRGLK